MNPLRRSTWFLASALDASKSRETRLAAWKAHERESWYEAVAYRDMPIMLVPYEHISHVRALMFERHEGPITGTHIRP